MAPHDGFEPPLLVLETRVLPLDECDMKRLREAFRTSRLAGIGHYVPSMFPATHPLPPYAADTYLGTAGITARLPVGSFERRSVASMPRGMARYRMRQPPARFAPIAERDHYPTGRASALPGGTGDLGRYPRRDTATRVLVERRMGCADTSRKMVRHYPASRNAPSFRGLVILVAGAGIEPGLFGL